MIENDYCFRLAKVSHPFLKKKFIQICKCGWGAMVKLHFKVSKILPNPQDENDKYRSIHVKLTMNNV